MCGKVLRHVTHAQGVCLGRSEVILDVVTLTKIDFIGKQDSGKNSVKGIMCYHGNAIFDTVFSHIFTF